MFFEGFEGYKKINNINLSIDEIFNLLSRYEKEIGTVKLDGNHIIADVPNKYEIDIRIEGDYIIIERRLEKGQVKDYETALEDGKDLAVAQTDRMIEQIYDLINDYIQNNGNVSEHITSVQKILYMDEIQKNVLGFSLGNSFYVRDQVGNELYEVKKKGVNKLYTIENLQSKREVFTVKYENMEKNKYTIVKSPFDTMEFSQDTESVKTVLKGKTFKREIKISADYTDNHYLIELNEIVIGAIDCLDPLQKNRYKIEINNEKEEALIIAISVMLDLYNLKNNNELGIQ